jgi:cation:H+ antiporter
MIWLEFLVCIAAIGYAGSRLSRYGDIVAQKTGIGRTWVGMVMLATVTSLPELATGVSAVTLADSPNIAVGDVLGSCVFNLVILVVVDALYREGSIYSRASQGHILSAGFGVMLIGFVGFSLVLGARGTTPAIGHVGLYSPLIALLYALAVRTVFLYERREIAEFVEARTERRAAVTLRGTLARYAVAAFAVLAFGTWLPLLGRDMAEAMGWHESFVGTLFVAAATSVPEIAVTIGALRIGALDLAIGNLLGSNLFNIVILAVDDLLFVRGPILSHVSPVHAASAFSAVVMTGATVIGFFYRPTGRVLQRIGWISLVLFSAYILNAYVLFLHRS